MKRAVFPVAVGIFTWASWVSAYLAEQWISATTASKFDFWTGLEVVVVFASVGAALAVIVAGLARVTISGDLSLETIVPQCVAAAPSGAVPALVLYGVIHWDMDIGGIAGMLFGGLLLGFLACCASLVAVGYVVKKI